MKKNLYILYEKYKLKIKYILLYYLIYNYFLINYFIILSKITWIKKYL